MKRDLGFCATACVTSKAIAHELAGRTIPTNVDMDHIADQEAVSQIVVEIDTQDKVCAECGRNCEDASHK